MASGRPPIDPHDLETRLRQLESIHRSLGDEIAALRLMQKEYGLGTFVGTIDPITPYQPATKLKKKPASVSESDLAQTATDRYQSEAV